MAVVMGMLIDTSSSMKDNVHHVEPETLKQYRGATWAHSIFRVVDGLIKNDVSEDNKVFVIGFGAKTEPCIFDLLNTVKDEREWSMWDKETVLETILDKLDHSGATYVRNWVTVEQLMDEVSYIEAKTILRMIVDYPELKDKFIQDCLPKRCRDKILDQADLAAKTLRANKAAHTETLFLFVCFIGMLLLPVYTDAMFLVLGSSAGGIVTYLTDKTIKQRLDEAIKEAIREVLAKGLELLKEQESTNKKWDTVAKRVGSNSVISIRDAQNILKSYVSNENLTDDTVNLLIDTIEPFIYGTTPFINQSLKWPTKFFSRQEFRDHKKLLFLLSDGKIPDLYMLPTMRKPFPVLETLKRLNVHIVCCMITNDHIDNPKQLYSSDCNKFVGAAESMFQMSTTIATKDIPRTAFVKRDWTIDHTTNETKLFFEINHPDLIEDVCLFAKEVVCSQDALCDLLASVSLDLYINQCNDGFKPTDQDELTCYANAAATVIHLAMQRIVGRENGYPEFSEIHERLKAKYGKKGADTWKVLKEECSNYRLRCKRIDGLSALKQITEKCPVLVRFSITDSELSSFLRFFKKNPKGILREQDLYDTRCPRSTAKSTKGHAVVMTSFNSESLRFMNSWGTSWGDSGFFRLQNANVLSNMEFFAVYWEESDLKPSEIRAFERSGGETADKLMKSLKGLQNATFTCPLCHVTSGLEEFEGHLVKVRCTKCNCEFDTASYDCHDLILNMYLTSLLAQK